MDKNPSGVSGVTTQSSLLHCRDTWNASAVEPMSKQFISGREHRDKYTDSSSHDMIRSL